jgi:serine/threonine-protein kinase
MRERVCPTTGKKLASEVARSRMSELPPPERRPKPLGFDPSHASQRIQPPPKPSRESASMPLSRNLQRDLVGQTIGGRYQVRDILGEGGMGTVYEALHLGLGRPVAIKILNPSQAKKRVAVKRFQQEARAAGAIGHPNICEVYDMGLLDDASPYLVMEKLVGTTLADRIAREGGLPFDELLDVMIQVLSGLIAAHDKGIVHRDIKPENIFLARRVGCPPIVKILDFGVSKMMAQFQTADDQLDLTRTGMVMGTPYYMSPEQARGERSLDGRVDVYACGVMMYEALVGKRPFLAPNYNALLLAIINTTPKPIRDIRPATPPQLEAMVARAMAKAREDRYPSALHFLRDVQSLHNAWTAQAAAPASPQHVPAPPTREERARAPIVGGRPVPANPGATLRSRMADAKSDEVATALDVRRDGRQMQERNLGIPIHITGAPPEAASDLAEDPPTEVFRPGKHHVPPPPVPAHRASQPTQLTVPRIQHDPTDYDGIETVVQRPGQPLPRKPFNPDDTVRISHDDRPSADLDFGDPTRIAPRKRPQR